MRIRKDYLSNISQLDSVEDILQYSKEMESTVMESDWDDRAKVNFLSMASLQRYSTVYWNIHGNGDDFNYVIGSIVGVSMFNSVSLVEVHAMQTIRMQ